MPASAGAVFGPRLPAAIRYVDLLATAGVERGLIGPAERPRLWTRHVLNSAAIAAALPPASAGPEPGLRVVDVGSGAGLPGIPLALARPDLAVTLLEPLARRAAFLHEALAALGVEADVVRGRAEEVVQPGWDVVVARAVAPLERLLVLADHLVHAGGMLVAVKGRTADAEVAAAAAAIARRSSRPAEVLTLGDEVAGATVVRVLYDRATSPRAGGRRRTPTARRRVS
jgi:16S rRNA (guanine527-N7)-methyltransferase